MGKTRQKIAAPPPPMEVYDEQEGFRVYESEVGRLLVGAYLRCRGRRTRGCVGCGGRPKRGRRRQRKLARRQKKLARRQRKLAERFLVLSAECLVVGLRLLLAQSVRDKEISVRRVSDGRSKQAPSYAKATEGKRKENGRCR